MSLMPYPSTSDPFWWVDAVLPIENDEPIWPVVKDDLSGLLANTRDDARQAYPGELSEAEAHLKSREAML